MLPVLILQWLLSTGTMACGIGAGLYLGQWLWATWPVKARRRR